jgi:HPt (histidine-containing phosphotransfer) domain-containing protein
MIDKEAFRENFKYYDKEIVLQVIDMFLADYAGIFEELQVSINNMDFNAIDNIAHSFKSNVAYMSAEVSELARILEHKGKDKNGEGLQLTFDKLKAGTALMVNELAEMRQEYV